MNRMWEIRERKTPKYGYRKESLSQEDEVYECGYEDGYKAAMREISLEERRSKY